MQHRRNLALQVLRRCGGGAFAFLLLDFGVQRVEPLAGKDVPRDVVVQKQITAGGNAVPDHLHDALRRQHDLCCPFAGTTILNPDHRVHQGAHEP